MSEYIAPLKDIRFAMKELAALEQISNLPAFAKPGQPIDVTVSSIGNAKSSDA